MPYDYFGPAVAARYDSDASVSAASVVDPVVDFLFDLAGGRRVLEFGVGTGRIALPLSRRGVEVAGIDLSPAMVEQLLAKPSGSDIDVTIGDFATTTVPGQFGLAYLVFNTIHNLTTQAGQVACFRNAADHLEPGGYFVIEVLVPIHRMLPPGQNLHAYRLSDDSWDTDEYHFATQDFTSHHYAVRDGELARNSIPFRYVWPEELDLMAQLAGMTRHGRWAGWQHEPFVDESTKHVSVWRKPEA